MLLAHVGDTHVGMTNYGKLNPHSGIHSRLEDFDRDMKELVATCINRNVDAFLFAGDAYKNASPTPSYRNVFEQNIKQLMDNGIPIVMITGNHDSTGLYGSSSALRTFQTLSDVVVVNLPQNVTIETKSGPLIVTCMPWPTRRMLFNADGKDYYLPPDEMLDKLQEHVVTKLHSLHDEIKETRAPKILLAHLDIDGATYSSEQTMIVKSSLVIPFDDISTLCGYSYIGLGHIHKHQHLSFDPPVVYSGSIDRVDFNEESEPKGFCLVHLQDDMCQEVEFVELDIRDMITMRIDLNDSLNPTDDLVEVIESKPIDESIVRIFYTLDSSSDVKVDTNRIYKALEKAYYIHGVYHLSDEQKHRVVEIKEQQPLKVIEEYIGQTDIYRPHKNNLMELAREYAAT